jgi:hypothetical protein
MLYASCTYGSPCMAAMGLVDLSAGVAPHAQVLVQRMGLRSADDILKLQWNGLEVCVTAIPRGIDLNCQRAPVQRLWTLRRARVTQHIIACDNISGSGRELSFPHGARRETAETSERARRPTRPPCAYVQDGGLFNPGHLVVADSARRAIVLAFRGTLNGRDCLTDLHCTYRHVELGGSLTGQVHAGMWEAAQRVGSSLLPLVTAALEARPGWDLAITGHSLGAGGFRSG